VETVNPYLTVIIPSHERRGLLHWALKEYNRQWLDPSLFEVIVVDDGSEKSAEEDFDKGSVRYPLVFLRKEKGGPAKARNYGVAYARGEVLLFVGDDCLPHPMLLYRHWLRHREANGEWQVIQGYTDWHPSLVDTFHEYLNQGGGQAAWNKLRNPEDGRWISRDTSIPGYFLTTNVSIPKPMFEWHTGFDESFPQAAWEDIEFAVRIQMHGGKTFFEPDALNWHYHRQTLDGFAKRQVMEGKSRQYIVAAHPQLAPQMLDPQGIRDITEERLQAQLGIARELHYNSSRELQELRIRRWHEAFRLCSLWGIKQGLAERGKWSPIWKAIEHLHIGDAIMQTAFAARSWEQKDYDYAWTCSEWAIRAESPAWCLPAVQGEIALAMGKKQDAIDLFRKSLEMGPGERWPMDRIEELSNV